ncbi:MAG: hypothetical protein Q8P92_00215 [Candidatus Daviesbacteria bacterium]|nr:hypothetical protein [Candidatus Daviesbacteria bacterium]
MKINLFQFSLFLALLGVVFVILTTSTFPFKNEILSAIYPKPKSLAEEGVGVPSVDLKVIVDGTAYDGILNVPLENISYTLFWETKENPTSCIGRVWGVSDEDESFKGPKGPSGGRVQTKVLDKNNPYVYTIDCQNGNGDSSGDSITINVGVSGANFDPFITDFSVKRGGNNLNSEVPIQVSAGESVSIEWKSSNTSTPYSVCVATGSWPTGYKNIGGATIVENFILPDKKVYNYAIYCSNESSYTQKGVTFLVN